MDGKEKPRITSVEEMVGRFTGELMAEIAEWKKRLSESAEDLGELKREIHASCAPGADLVVAGLVSVITMALTSALAARKRGVHSPTRSSPMEPWIWDRISMIVKLAKLTHVKRHEVLDNRHAAHHVSLALAALGLTDKERMPLYRQHRTLLRNGQWRRVVEELEDLAANEPESSAIHTEIAYLKKHGEAGRLS